MFQDYLSPIFVGILGFIFIIMALGAAITIIFPVPIIFPVVLGVIGFILVFLANLYVN